MVLPIEILVLTDNGVSDYGVKFAARYMIQLSVDEKHILKTKLLGSLAATAYDIDIRCGMLYRRGAAS